MKHTGQSQDRNGVVFRYVCFNLNVIVPHTPHECTVDFRSKCASGACL